MLCLYFCREFLAPGAHNPVNIDARIAELVRKRMEDNPNRYCFVEAQVTLYTFTLLNDFLVNSFF